MPSDNDLLFSGRRRDADAFLAARLRELRTGRRMSQTALARAMSSRGQRWHQQTVHRIESAKQGVDFNELVALAGIFGVPFDSFTPPQDPG